jgi:arabinofuranosyltransferase
MAQAVDTSRIWTFFARRARVQYVLIVLCLLYAGFTLATYPRWTVDDAYISFRYAYNLVHHGELNWNVGYDPVEGYTGIMLPLLVAPVIALGGDPGLASQVIGFVAFVASAVLLWRILVTLEVPLTVRAIAQSLFLVSPSFYTHVFAGLETMLFTALILASFDALLRRADLVLAPTLLLTSLTRPEGALLAGLFVVVRVVQIVRQRQSLVRFLLIIGLLLVVPGALYFAWRWSYYGYPLPNTFYVKVSGAHASATGLLWFAFYLLLPLFAALLTIPTLARVKKYGLELAAMLGFYGLLFVLYSNTSLIMNYGHRFYMPLYPAGLIALGALAGFEHRTLRRLAPAFIPLAAQFAWAFTLLLSAEKEWIVDYRDTLIHEHAATAAYINAHVPADEWVILNDTGIMPYVTQRKTIDSGALNDEFMAHTRDPQAVRAYLNSFHAAAITIPWFVGSDERGLDPYAVLPDPRNYQLMTGYKDPQWVATHKGFRVYLFMRKDLVK